MTAAAIFKTSLKAFTVASMTLLATVAFAAGKLTVTETVQLAAPADKVWDKVKDFDKWQGWHPAVASTKITKGGDNKAGTVRVLSLNGGGEINETLTAWDGAAKSQTYVINASPLPVDQYASTLSVAAKDGGTLVTWTSTFDAKGAPDADATKTISGVYRLGLDNLKKMMP
jgi:carbon monoxide dehydrogenase subunit G